jgi:hypothetical protein
MDLASVRPAPSPGSPVHGEAGSLKHERQLGGRHFGGAGLCGERGEVAQTAALEAPADEIKAHPVPNDGAELCVVPFDEHHAVTVVRVCAELQGFGEQSVKSFTEVDSVSRQEDAADFHTQHGLASPNW